jgi:hypothetical protein
MKTKTKFNYDFKNEKIKKAFQLYALENDTTLQQIITDSLKAKHKSLFTSKNK